MKTKQLKKLHQETRADLTKQADKLRTELTKLALEVGAGKVKDTNLVKKKRRDLARVMTIVKEKDMMPNKDNQTSKEAES